ncbi:MAG: hypothetical protein ACOX8R_01845 [Bacillota bacterium]|jgi:hypothetical protein
MKKSILGIVILIAVIVLAVVFYTQYRNDHTFTLSDEISADSYLKSEQIQPILGTVKVWGTQDTDVWFTDVENPENRFQIGYITPGMKETIKLEKGKWYIVHGSGDITIQMVNMRRP